MENDRLYEAKGKTEFLGMERGSSIWLETMEQEMQKGKENTEKSQSFPTKCDVLVIGAGMAGMLTAYKLYRQGIDVMIVDASVAGSGASKNTTAKITSQHGLFFDKLIRTKGVEQALQYVLANEHAIDDYEAIIQREQISCEFERKNNYVYTLENEKQIEKEKKAADSLRLDTLYNTNLKLPFQVKASIGRPNQAQFHPLKFIEGIKKLIPVWEHVAVYEIHEDGKVDTSEGICQANQVVMATHYPLMNVPGYYFLKLYQERSYLMCLEDFEATERLRLDGMYIDENSDGLTFRNYKDYLILGEGNHRSGKKNLKNYYGDLLRLAGEYFPTAAVVSTWSNQDCMTPDGIPYIGRYSKKYPNFYVATGFNMWGMSSSMVAANIISDMICGLRNESEDVFSPQRNLIAGTPKLVKSVAITSISLAKELLKIPEMKIGEIRRGDAGIVKIDGRRIGVYHDSNGTFYYVSTKCPHLGCSLEWNRNEGTWDCPCHGSRFDYKGNLISNPASTGTFIGCRRHKSENEIAETENSETKGPYDTH